MNSPFRQKTSPPINGDRPDNVNILYILLSLEVGGLENGVINLINYAHDPRFRHVICCLRRRGDMESRIRKKNVSIHCMDSKGDEVSLPFRLAALMRKERINLVRCMNAEAFFYGFVAAKLARTPVIFYSNGGRSFPEKKHRVWVERLFSHLTDQVTVNSDNLKTEMISQIGINPGKIVVLDNGVDTKKFDSRRFPDSGKLLKSLGLTGEEKIIGTVGRLSRQKDHKTLLAAFAKANRSIPLSRLVIVGDGVLQNELEDFASKLSIRDKVLFLGARNDTPELYSVMNVFVLSSFTESFPNVILEAMSSSLPVIATDVGASRRIVTEGETGFVTPVGDVDYVSQRLQYLLQTPEKAVKMGQLGRKRVEENYSMDSMVERYESCYWRHLREKRIVV